MHQFLAYLKFLWHSKNEHGVHSPFVYDLLTNCLYQKEDKPAFKTIEDYRKAVLKDEREIRVKDFGAGSRVFRSDTRKVADIAKNAGISGNRAILLNKLTSYFKVKHALELGTSVGISSVAIAAGNELKLLTVEGCPETSKIADEYFKRFGLGNIKLVTGSFEEIFEPLREELKFQIPNSNKQTGNNKPTFNPEQRIDNQLSTNNNQQKSPQPPKGELKFTLNPQWTTNNTQCQSENPQPTTDNQQPTTNNQQKSPQPPKGELKSTLNPPLTHIYDNSKPTTDNAQPTTDNAQKSPQPPKGELKSTLNPPLTFINDDPLPTTYNPQRTTNNTQRPSENLQPTTDNGQPTTDNPQKSPQPPKGEQPKFQIPNSNEKTTNKKTTASEQRTDYQLTTNNKQQQSPQPPKGELKSTLKPPLTFINDNPLPTSYNPQRTTDNRKPKTENRQPTTNHQQPKTDLIFFDGNHQKDATLRYFHQLLPLAHNDSVFIFDDIHWSPGMEEAWEEIKEHPRVRVTIDSFYWGIVFFREEQEKEHFIIRL